MKPPPLSYLAACLLLPMLLGYPRVMSVIAGPPAAIAEETAIQFSRSGWHTNEWSPVRLPNQEQAIPLAQMAKSIGTTTNTFTTTDYSKERDNALLVYDTKTTEGEIEVVFGLGQGFHGTSSPGICISPKLKDGVFEKGIAAFVASYAMVVWYEYWDGSRMRYIHLGQLARWTDPSTKHILRCRFSKKEKSVGIQLDDSDILVFCFVGDSRLSYIDHEINSTVALWGCHGECHFYEMKVRAGSMPFHVREPTALK